MQWHFHVACACWNTSHVLEHTHSHLFMPHDLAFMAVCVRASTFKSGFSPTPPPTSSLQKYVVVFFASSIVSLRLLLYTHRRSCPVDRPSAFWNETAKIWNCC